MFIPLRKVDAAQRLVYGQIDETPDRSKEVFDYASSKPNFEAWSNELKKASDGKNLGNVRSMHKAVAAGKLVELVFNDDAKRIEVCAHIVDNDEWEKIEEGVYTGFSPGGKYLKRWRDGGITRYTAKPSELSLVDFPCIPTATFTMVKGDGLAEEHAFKTLSGDDLRKSLYQVGQLAGLFDSLTSLAQSAAWEATSEKDNSPLPGRLRDWLSAGVPIFTDMAREEASEALANLSATVAEIPEAVPSMQLAAKTEDLAKVGARHSSADKEHLQAIHDHAVSMGADCGGNAAKAAGGDDDLAKMVGDLTAAKGDLVKAVGENNELKKRISELEAAPQPGGPALMAISKAEDTSGQNNPTSDDGTGSFEERLAKIDSMPAGGAKGAALRKLAEQTALPPR